jgi:hypothetical protein
MLRRPAWFFLAAVLVPATVRAEHHHLHDDDEGDSGGGCGGRSTSSPQVAPAPSPEPQPAVNRRVFVTSITYSGALGGVTAADAMCQARADAAGLVGTFQAWISDDVASAYDRTVDVGPWYTTRGEVGFWSKSDLRAAAAAPLADEYGGDVADSGATWAWSGTNADGASTGTNCNRWTDATESASATVTKTAWDGGTLVVSCDTRAPLICFEQ